MAKRKRPETKNTFIFIIPSLQNDLIKIVLNDHRKWINGATYNLRSPPLFLIVSFPCKRESRYYEQQIPAGVYPGENRGRNDQAG